MIKFVHLLIMAVYLTAPVAACLRASFLPTPKRRRIAFARLRLTVMAGTFAGILLCAAYAYLLHGRMVFTQTLLTGYLAISLMLILQAFDKLLWNLSRWVFQLQHKRGSLWWLNLRALLGLLLRAGIVFGIGLPYVLATVMTYRPRIASDHDPQQLYRWNFQHIEFPATDGTHIVGWWIPAPQGAAVQTVLLCPGPNADKASQLSLVQQLIPDGYNVLVFDFRAHGESDGQLVSYGDLERNDVLGAMRWLRQTHPNACKKVAGLGVSSGGAALLAAAADPSPEGQGIDAIAIYGGFDRLDNALDAMATQYVPPPLSWFVNHLGLRFASCQVGANLPAFSPVSEIKAIWPRPVLIIHAMDDEYIPFEQGQSLYDAASEPKMNLWLTRCRHEGAMRSSAAANLVRRCFDAAQRVI